MGCDISTRSHLFRGIVMSGGTTMLPGFAERMSKEMKALASVDVQ